MVAVAELTELEQFRTQVRTWLNGNADGVEGTVDAYDLNEEQYGRNHAFIRELGTKGWYAPGWPVEYGGGGLPREKVRIIYEELEHKIPYIESVRLPGDVGGPVAASVTLLGSEEQKRDFLPRVLNGDLVTWELYTEPDAGSDLPSLKTQAVRDGDNYIISGTKVFVGGNFSADQYYVLAVTDPEGKRHENLSVFIVPADKPGISITPLVMIAGHRKRTITLDKVVVPAYNRVGREGDGWRSFNSMFAGQQYGPVGFPSSGARDHKLADRLISYAKTNKRAGERIMDLPGPRVALAKLWMDTQFQRLQRERNAELAESGSGYSYQGAQTSLNGKLYGLRVGEAIQKTLGQLANISDTTWAPENGELEYFQRQAIVNTHPGGTCETQKLRMYRAMAASRGFKTSREG